MFVEKGSVEMNKSILYGHGVDSQTIHRCVQYSIGCTSRIICHHTRGRRRVERSDKPFRQANKEHGIFSWQFALHLGTMEKETEAFSPENPELRFSLLSMK